MSSAQELNATFAEGVVPGARYVLRVLGTLACLILTTGCASLLNYTRPIDLGHHSYAMDIKQRVVLSKSRTPSPSEWLDHQTTSREPGAKGSRETADTIVVCAEPSPDALTVLGVAGGLSFKSGKLDVEGDLGGALSESGAFVGLRTHSIQLLRDAMYRLCEGYAAGAMTPETFRGMQRRFQSTMMGLIAIEQLTGPVKATHAMLTSAASAGAGIPASDAAVGQAQERADATDERLLKARADVTREISEAETARTALQENLEMQKKSPKDAALQAQGKQLTATWDAAKRELADAQVALELAERASAEAQQSLNGARGRASANTAGSVRLGQAAEAVAASNADLVKGVVDIVTEINLSYLRDSCYAFTVDMLDKPGRIKALNELPVASGKDDDIKPVLMLKSMIGTCAAILKYEASRMIAQVDKGNRASRETTSAVEKSTLQRPSSLEIFEAINKDAKVITDSLGSAKAN